MRERVRKDTDLTAETVFAFLEGQGEPFNVVQAGKTANLLLKGIHRAAQHFHDMDFDGTTPADMARILNQAVRAADDLTRLAQFAQGKPDSRPDQAGEWLRALTDAQLQTVQGWIEEATR